MIVPALLTLSALLVLRAIMQRSEARLALGLAVYVGVVMFILVTQPELFVPAVVLALALACLALARFMFDRSTAAPDAPGAKFLSFFDDPR
ncbi:MAG: hypothetical protein ACM33T_00215 [Solirubrobacterales bacterium]